jgi:murein DD-endopeptidase MepM/ murein hydrolase activator NlpD
LVVVGAMLAGAAITAAFGESGSPSPGVVVEWLRNGSGATATPPPTLDGSLLTPGPTRTAAAPVVVEGFAYPVAGGCLPEDDMLMPGAPREYRNGIHEGVDFYDADNCVVIGLETEVLAAKAGTVVRADLAYRDLTAAELAELEELVERGGSTSEVEDAYRGRQVWIDHGGGIVTRYAHLGGIAEGIAIGTRVAQGDVIGYVGDSGTPESVTEPDTQVHLHFEIRTGDGYLGQGLDANEVRALYERAFSGG